MKDFGWDIKYALWLLAALILTTPIFLLSPLVYLFVIATLLTLAGIKRVLIYRDVSSWEKAHGKLIKTDIGQYRISIGQYSKPEVRYFPLAYFSYQYGDYSSESNQYAFDRKSIWSTDLDEIDLRLAELEAKKTIDVYVNPQHPHKAVINTQISPSRWSHAWAVLISGVTLLFISVLLWSIQ